MPFIADWRQSSLARFLQENPRPDSGPDQVRIEFHPGPLPDLSRLTPAHRTNRLLTWYYSGPNIWLRWECPHQPQALWVAEIALAENRGRVYFPPATPALLAAEFARTDSALKDHLRPPAGPPDEGLSLAFLSNIYRLLSVLFLAPRHGLLHHASAALGQDRMWLFAGRSGIGKSTLARLLAGQPRFTIVGDEAAATRRRAAGYHAHGTPWPSSAGFADNADAALGGLFFLQQSPVNRITPLTPRAALHQLLPATNLLWWHPDWMPRMLEECERLVQSVPVWQFAFAPTPAAADHLARFLADPAANPD